MKTTNIKDHLLLFLAFALLCFSCKTSMAQEVKKQKKEDIVIGLNAYSFSDLLMARDYRDNQQVYTLFNLLDWCASKNIKALDPTGYFFPTYPEVPSDEYIEKFKNKATKLGIIITGTGIRNNFASPDPKIRAEGVELAKNWILVASKLGAPVLRVFAGAIPEGYEDNWKVPAQWMIDCYKELIPTAEQYGVKIGIQNHGEMLQTAEQCLYVLKAVNSKMAGIIVDTGNFKTEDPYKDIAMVTPYAVNWQVKESPLGIGGDEETDYLKLIKIIKDGGYKGYIPVETLLVRGVPYDPFALVPEMLEKLQKAIDTVYE